MHDDVFIFLVLQKLSMILKISLALKNDRMNLIIDFLLACSMLMQSKGCPFCRLLCWWQMRKPHVVCCARFKCRASCVDSSPNWNLTRFIVFIYSKHLGSYGLPQISMKHCITCITLLSVKGIVRFYYTQLQSACICICRVSDKWFYFLCSVRHTVSYMLCTVEILWFSAHFLNLHSMPFCKIHLALAVCQSFRFLFNSCKISK